MRLFYHHPFHQPLQKRREIEYHRRGAGEEYGVPYLFSDFKKRNGYKRSIELSREYHLYRQNYCGCVYSRAAALALDAK